MIDAHITDGKRGTKDKVMVSSIGQLITAPYAYDEVEYIDLAADDTGYTFFKPILGFQFVLTGVDVTVSREVPTQCVVDIYESVGEDSATIAKSIFEFDMLKNAHRGLVGLNVLISEGVFLNAKSDDTSVFTTLMGYYIPKIS